MLENSISGALPIQKIQNLIQTRSIIGVKEDHPVQPSSIDLSISNEIYRMRGSFLPQKGESVRDILREGILFPTSLDIPLELQGIYLVRLQETLDLPVDIHAYANNKSSSGRINLQTRLIADGVPQFDKIPPGYQGELWLEIIPKSFPVKLKTGEYLNQIRFFQGDARLSQQEHFELHKTQRLLYNIDGKPLPEETLIIDPDGLTTTIDLSSQQIIGFKSTPTTCRLLDYTQRDLNPFDFFEPIYRPKNGQVVMRRGEFYIFVTKEFLRVPLGFAMEITPYNPSSGEFRSHYAGFFDPGFGFGNKGEILGTPAVLEIFTYDNDFILRDGQSICKIVYERLIEPSLISYGDPCLGSHYFNQRGPQLSKHFSMNKLLLN
ncbi:2'-deoxycytidine 5'-triphosphate deaminase [Candidatus Uhrbacteria bacterium CG_4_9_14_3_um_filter_36_7]|uniref:2'-deoxycytidine 5'-triphosphate deaminase n=1 Tax=Candidatus Uhrbacteria bacterium CG_4_9_14_3_um_filter_36_7 TaxID=1975033 RepID=A0A2M7XIC2_9BACT|nr:MAG: 2'-deoxycytidine 5'-triphosphate deaminase [Candidatus Uhrbacteria bacterium CG_4_9_14_3_um_filter_36_7]